MRWIEKDGAVVLAVALLADCDGSGRVQSQSMERSQYSREVIWVGVRGGKVRVIVEIVCVSYTV